MALLAQIYLVFFPIPFFSSIVKRYYYKNSHQNQVIVL